MSRNSILVVEDDDAIRGALCMALEDEDYCVAEAADGRSAIRSFFESPPDLVMLDLVLPGGMDGIEVCRRVRAMAPTPVLMLSGMDAEDRKIEALRAGADDYIVKGIGIGELMARVEASIRRTRSARSAAPRRFSDGALDVDFTSQVVRSGNGEVQLTPIEYRLLMELIKAEGTPVPASQLLANVWGPEYETDNLVKWHMSRLRRKLEDLPGAQGLIMTRRGFGYVYQQSRIAA